MNLHKMETKRHPCPVPFQHAFAPWVSLSSRVEFMLKWNYAILLPLGIKLSQMLYGPEIYRQIVITRRVLKRMEIIK